MTLTQALLAAVASETACIIFLFGIMMAKNKTQDAKLAECELDRKALQAKYERLQTQIANIWESLYTAGVKPAHPIGGTTK